MEFEIEWIQFSFHWIQIQLKKNRIQIGEEVIKNMLMITMLKKILKIHLLTNTCVFSFPTKQILIRNYHPKRWLMELKIVLLKTIMMNNCHWNNNPILWDFVQKNHWSQLIIYK